MWAKFAVLTFAAVIIPVFIPTQYVPFDPKVRPGKIVRYQVPISTLTPHRTQLRTLVPNRQPPGFRSFSIVSWTVSFSRPLVSHIYLLKNFLPWLTTIGHAISFKRVSPYVPPCYMYNACDSNRNRPVPRSPFWGHQEASVLWSYEGIRSRVHWPVFTPCIAGQCSSSGTDGVRVKPILQTVSNFLGPLAINRLLTYLGNGGKDALIRPWVWVFLLSMSPLMGSIVFHWLVHFARVNVE